MIAYFLIGGITVFLAYITLHMQGGLRIIFVLISGIPCSLLAAFRYDIGPDYFLYNRIFDSIKLTGSFFSVKSLEPGYVFLNQVVLVFGGNFQLLLFLVAWFISTLFFLGALRLSKNYVLSIALFFIMGFYFDSLNGIRQYMAAALTFFALTYISKGEKRKAVLACCIACLFHQSAIIMILVCLFVYRARLSSVKAIGLIILAVLLGNLLYELVTRLLIYTRYSYYLTSIEYAVEPTLGATVITATITILAILVGVYGDGTKYEDEHHRAMINMNTLAVLSAVMSFYIPLALRIQYYFLPFEIVFLPHVLSFIESQNIRLIIGGILSIMFAFMTIIGMVFNGWYAAFPYQAVI